MLENLNADDSLLRPVTATPETVNPATVKKEDKFFYKPTLPEWIGLKSYKEVYNLQVSTAAQVRNTDQIAFIGCEHPTVVTLGKRGTAADILNPSIDYVETDRGGLATLHSPGQLVIYPIIDLKQNGLTVRDYVGLLLYTTQCFLDEYKIKTFKKGDAGIYTDFGKIGFAGIRVSDHVAYHGVSINVQNDLNLFRLIRPCGAQDACMDSMSQVTGKKFELQDLYLKWVRTFVMLKHL
jgi:lipoate-protein ligase B